MANTTKEKKNTAPTKKEIETELKDTQSALAEATELIKQLQAKLAEQPQVVVQQAESKGKTSKIKCINLGHCVLNLSTEPNGMGRVFTFNEYGQAHFIKYDDLLDIVSSYPNTIESGLVYIANKDFCVEQGIYEDITQIYTKDMVDKIVYLRDDTDVDLLCNMSKPLLETTIMEIARLYNMGEEMEPNKLARIKNELGYDITELAKDVQMTNDAEPKTN